MNINYNSLIKNIDSKLDSIYLIYGEEQYLVQNVLNKIKKKFGELVQGINYILIDESSIASLISEIETPSFGYDKKLIIIRNTGLFKKDGRRKKLTPEQDMIYNFISSKDNIELIETNAILVFVEISVDKNDVFTQISKVGTVCEINELKPQELTTRLSQICNLYKVKCDSRVLLYLIERSGTNLEILINEIRKLIEHTGENGTINIEDVDNLAIKQFDSVIFDLTDNLANKKIDKAMEVLDELIYQKVEMLVILKTLYTHFKRLYLCKKAIASNINLASALGLKPNQTFLVNKYRNQVSHFDEKILRKILEELNDLDYKFKTAKIDIDIGLRSIICSYCA